MADIDYDLERAKREAVLAIQAEHPSAEAAHRRLSARYSARAVIAIVNEQDKPREKARHRGQIAMIRASQSARG